jgi:hypothetical protein
VSKQSAQRRSTKRTPCAVCRMTGTVRPPLFLKNGFPSIKRDRTAKQLPIQGAPHSKGYWGRQTLRPLQRHHRQIRPIGKRPHILPITKRAARSRRPWQVTNEHQAPWPGDADRFSACIPRHNDSSYPYSVDRPQRRPRAAEMHRLSVNIIDILGVLVPGSLLLAGVLLIPIPRATSIPPTDTLGEWMPVVSTPWAAVGTWLIVAYLFGFLLRLFSVNLMQRLTWRRWVPRVHRDAEALSEVLTSAIANASLTRSLIAVAVTRGPRDPGRHAPYYHFLKRLVRTRQELWTEAERLEAEARFAAGLFLPSLVYVVDGILWRQVSAASWVFILAGSLTAMLVLLTFPSRRAKEMLYVQYLGLAILLYREQPVVKGAD